MPYDADQIANLEAEIDALESPTTEDVLAFSDDYDAGIVAASALRRSLSAGGGSQPDLSIVTIGFADIIPDQLGDGSNAAPLVTVPAGGVLNIIGFRITEGFNDSGVTGSDTLQVVDAADASNFAPWSAPDLGSPTPESGAGYYQFDIGAVYFYFPASAPMWALFNTNWEFDGTTGSVDIFFTIQTAA